MSQMVTLWELKWRLELQDLLYYVSMIRNCISGTCQAKTSIYTILKRHQHCRWFLPIQVQWGELLGHLGMGVHSTSTKIQEILPFVLQMGLLLLLFSKL